MPDIDIEYSGIETIDVEVWCDTCGKGLCGYTSVDNRGHTPSFRVEACPDCIAEKDNKIEELKDIIEDFEDKITNLENEISELNGIIDTLKSKIL